MGDGHIWVALAQGEYIIRASPPFLVLNHVMKLVTVDEKKTVIAEFHSAHHFMKNQTRDIMNQIQKARLEVQPEGMDMLDYIILTFVIAEKKRRQREGESEARTGPG